MTPAPSDMALPFIEVLIALKDEVADALDGLATVRHHRRRESREDEWPCLAIRYVSNDVSQITRQETDDGTPEAVWELAVDLVIDMEVAPEPDTDLADDPDPTGLNGAARLTARVLDRLFPGEGIIETLGGRVWDMRYDGTAPDEESNGLDTARMAERLTLLYRVRADQPTTLLRES